MRVRVLTSLHEFDALAPLWREMLNTSGQTSPFTSHDWFACCWRTAGVNRQREVWLFEDAAGPLAFVPLVRFRSSVRGLPVRALRVLDTPDSPFTDFPVIPPVDDVVGFFLDVLAEKRDWDAASFPKLPTGSPIFKALGAMLPGFLPWRIAGRESRPYVSIVGTWPEHLRRCIREAHTLEEAHRALRRTDVVTIEEHRRMDPDSPVFAETMEIFSHGVPVGLAIAKHGLARFFRELTLRASANGWLSVWLLRREGRAVAAEYQLGDRHARHTLRAECDAAADDATGEAGLTATIVESLFRHRDVQHYYLPPHASDAVRGLADGVHEGFDVRIYSRTSYGRLVQRAEGSVGSLVRRFTGRGEESCA